MKTTLITLCILALLSVSIATNLKARHVSATNADHQVDVTVGGKKFVANFITAQDDSGFTLKEANNHGDSKVNQKFEFSAIKAQAEGCDFKGHQLPTKRFEVTFTAGGKAYLLGLGLNTIVFGQGGSSEFKNNFDAFVAKCNAATADVAAEEDASEDEAVEPVVAENEDEEVAAPAEVDGDVTPAAEEIAAADADVPAVDAEADADTVAEAETDVDADAEPAVTVEDAEDEDDEAPAVANGACPDQTEAIRAKLIAALGSADLSEFTVAAAKKLRFNRLTKKSTKGTKVAKAVLKK